MEIIREALDMRSLEYPNAGFRAIVRTDCYGNQLSYFDMLFQAAKTDFPTLNREDVEIVQYGGSFIKRIHGIEFHVQTLPKNYSLTSPHFVPTI